VRNSPLGKSGACAERAITTRDPASIGTNYRRAGEAICISIPSADGADFERAAHEWRQLRARSEASVPGLLLAWDGRRGLAAHDLGPPGAAAEP